jgi:hypothetical protein
MSSSSIFQRIPSANRGLGYGGDSLYYGDGAVPSALNTIFDRMQMRPQMKVSVTPFSPNLSYQLAKAQAFPSMTARAQMKVAQQKADIKVAAELTQVPPSGYGVL